jgi:hypothetical protein
MTSVLKPRFSTEQELFIRLVAAEGDRQVSRADPLSCAEVQCKDCPIHQYIEQAADIEVDSCGNAARKLVGIIDGVRL